MLFKEFGDKKNPALFLLHGGGLSSWSYGDVIGIMARDYFIVVPVLDGHGEDGSSAFISIEDSAQKLIDYMDSHFGGSVFAIAGLSLGAQITVEALSKRQNIAKYAVIESALVVPLPGTALLSKANGLFYGLIRHRWFSKLQAKSLALPDALFENYYRDSLRLTKQSLINISLSNGNYRLKASIADTGAKILIIAGEKEPGIMKKSAALLHEKIPGSAFYLAPRMHHGELSLCHPTEYAEMLMKFFSE